MIRTCLKCPWTLPLSVLAAMPVWAADENVKAAKQSRPVELQGTVYEIDGRPAGEAAVWAYPFEWTSGNSHRMVETTADADGRFKLGLTPGEWRVMARKQNRSGSANNQYGLVSIIPSNPPDPCIIRLTPRGVLCGRLLDRETGQPVCNGQFWIDEVGLVQADENGRYEVQGLSPEPHHLVALCPGYVRTYRLFDTTLRPEAELDLRLTRGVKLTGRIVDDSDKPIPRACVGDPASGGSTTAIVALYEPCDERGRFVWDSVAVDHSFMLEAVAPGYKSEEKDVFVPKGTEPPELIFMLKPEQPAASLPTRTIEGIVKTPAGRPVSGAAVRWYTDYRQRRRCETKTDVRGHFTLGRATDEIGYLEVTAKGHAPAYEAVLQQGNLRGDITLDSGRTVRGRVQDSIGKPMEGVMIVPVAAANPEPACVEPWVWQLHTLTDKNGWFELKNLPKDGFRYDFHSLAEGRQPLTSVQDGMTVTLTGGGAIRGRVLDPQGKPMRDFRISLDLSQCEKTRPAFEQFAAPASQPGDSHTHVTGGFYAGLSVDMMGVLYTSNDGTFVLNGLDADGIEIVVADWPGYGRTFVDCVHTRPVEKLASLQELTLQLRPAYPLRVRVVQDAAPDKPIAGAAVGLMASPIPGSPGDYTRSRFYWGPDCRVSIQRHTDAGGWVSFPDLSFEGATVIVQAASFARQRVECRGTQPEVIVRLKPECIVSGLITERGGRQPMRECFVQLERGKQEEIFGIRVGPADKGRFRFTELPAGKYVLQVARNELERHVRIFHRVEFTLREGETHEFSTIGKVVKVQFLDCQGRPARATQGGVPLPSSRR